MLSSVGVVVSLEAPVGEALIEGLDLKELESGYDEMCKISRKLFPDIWYLMNVDGGGSAVLGVAVGKSFMELSYPALSLESTVGMIRPISTILCLK